MRPTCHRLFAATTAMLGFAGCSMEDTTPGASDDLAALRDIVTISIPVKSGHWEIFGTPEYKGGVPAPTDFTTLIAELEPADRAWIERDKHMSGKVHIVPEAARPWLNDQFRSWLAANRNTSVDLTSQPNCRQYETSLKKTGKAVSGLVCAGSRGLLLYLTLSSSL